MHAAVTECLCVMVGSSVDMESFVLENGFMPFFSCGIPGFSIEENTPAELWFSADDDGPWEWKGPVIREGHCAYGKMFCRKAGFVSLEWLPDMINYRRSKRYAKDDDTAALDDAVLQTIMSEDGATVKELRRMLGFVKGRGRRADCGLVDSMPDCGKVSLEPILTRLMMSMRVVISDFEYNIDRHGNPYGWGVARYALPETLYGRLDVRRTPEESFDRICSHLARRLPSVAEDKIIRLVG